MADSGSKQAEPNIMDLLSRQNQGPPSNFAHNQQQYPQYMTSATQMNSPPPPSMLPQPNFGLNPPVHPFASAPTQYPNIHPPAFSGQPSAHYNYPGSRTSTPPHQQQMPFSTMMPSSSGSSSILSPSASISPSFTSPPRSAEYDDSEKQRLNQVPAPKVKQPTPQSVLKKRDQQEGDAPGVILSGNKVTVNADVPIHASKKVRELVVTPITLYSSEYVYRPGSFIAINKLCICYSVRGDMIRVISKKTASRDLLKGHAVSISEMQFINEESDILASGDTTGNIFVWRISETDNNPITHEQLLHVQGSPLSGVLRIAWHPTNWNLFVTAESDNTVKIWDRSRLSTKVERNRDLWTELPGLNDIHDVSFSPDGRLAVASSNSVSLWNGTSLVKKWQPYGTEAVSGVVFFEKNGVPLLLTGAVHNSELKLWEVDPLRCLQTITFFASSSESLFNHFTFDQHTNYMFLADSKSNFAYTLHLKSTDGDFSFDYITQFQVAQPVLSLIVTNQDHRPKHNDGEDMQLYCVQTKAIQLYHVNSEHCWSPHGAKESEAVRVENTTPEKPIQQIQTSQSAPITPPSQATALQQSQSQSQLQSQSQATTSPSLPVDRERAANDILAMLNQNSRPTQPLPFSENKPEPEILVPDDSVGETESDRSEQTVDLPNNELMTPLAFSSENKAPEEENQSLPHLTEESDVSSLKSDQPEESSVKTPSILAKLEAAVGEQVASTPNAEERAVTPSKKNRKAKKEKNVEKKDKQAEKREIIAEANPTGEKNEVFSPTSESHDLNRLDRLMQQHFDRLYQRLESERKEREKVERERQERLLDAISKTLNVNMANQMEKIIAKELQTVTVPTLSKNIVQAVDQSLFKPMQENFKKIMLQNIAPKLESMVKESVASKEFGQFVGENIGASVRQPVQEAFAHYFANALIPAFEKSCQNMFAQISGAFDRGLTDRVQQGMIPASSSSSSTAVDQMKIAVQSLVEVTNSMTKAVVDTQTKILNDYVDRANRSQSFPPVQNSNSAQNKTKELQLLVNQEKFEEAFTSALSARNMQVLVWLCGQLDTQTIFSNDRLSQQVLLSLIQQLGFDLSKDTLLKLTWLREAVLGLNTKDTATLEHANAVLRNLRQKLEEQLGKPGVSATAQYKLLFHLVNSLVK
eukprot:TRINITY_DN3907_c0_g2_i1.p1 TRINITY_DN3907_c0_g2~~TRINITY_DN3907_c0_g2_i1.p1  ORF type:complete len:1160 (-),score=315.41 TRINITY_DN3907_c0_g2_i1:451-3906(-)